MLRRIATRLLAIGAAAVFLGGLAAAVVLAVDDGATARRAAPQRTAPARPAARPKPAPPAPAPKQAPAPEPKAKPPQPVRAYAVATYDPEGDGHEKDELLSLATDGDPATAWTTESYDSWGWKQGVGIVVRTDRPLRLARLVVVSDTPGFRADVRAGASAEGPFTPVSATKTATATTVFPLRESAPRQFHLVWITQLHEDPKAGGSVRLGEIRAFAAQ